MDRQDELLEKEDGRYYAIDKVGTGLGSIATSEKLKKKIVLIRSSILDFGVIPAFGSLRLLEGQRYRSTVPL